LGDDELLEILSATNDPTRVQPHLKKCFDGIAELEFLENFDIQSMISSEGEHLKMSKLISTSGAGSVEKWFSDVEKIMRETVRGIIVESKLWVEKLIFFNFPLLISPIHTFVNIPALLLKNTPRSLIRAGILTNV
jgi:hypothetical protein